MFTGLKTEKSFRLASVDIMALGIVEMLRPKANEALEKMYRWTSKNVSNEFGAKFTEEEQEAALDDVFSSIYGNDLELSSALFTDGLNGVGSALRVREWKQNRATGNIDSEFDSLTELYRDRFKVDDDGEFVKHHDDFVLKDGKKWPTGSEKELCMKRRDELEKVGAEAEKRGKEKSAYQIVENWIGAIEAERVGEVINLLSSRYGDANPDLYRTQRFINRFNEISAFVGSVNSHANIIKQLTEVGSDNWFFGDENLKLRKIATRPRKAAGKYLDGAKGLASTVTTYSDGIDAVLEIPPVYLFALGVAINQAAIGAAYMNRGGD